jgi:hypothetical protein
MLRSTFEPKMEVVTRRWLKLRNEELGNLYPSINIITVNNSNTRWTEHLAHVEEIRNACTILVAYLKGRDVNLNKRVLLK